MQLFARVVDSATGQGLPGATISVDGKPIAISDSAGNFAIDSATGAMNISASYVGYNSNSLPEGVIADDGQIQLTRADQTLPPASIVAVIKKNPLPFAIGAGGLLLLLNAKKKKKMGKIDTSTILIIAAVGVGAYLLLRPRTAAVSPYAPNPYAPNPYQNPYLPPPQSTTAQDIAAGAGALTNIFTSIFGAKSGGGGVTDYSAV